MPESPDFQKIYPPEANEAIETYLGNFEETGLTLVDGRTWVEEAGLDDRHHLTPEGALEFTKRFGGDTVSRTA